MNPKTNKWDEPGYFETLFAFGLIGVGLSMIDIVYGIDVGAVIIMIVLSDYYDSIKQQQKSNDPL